MMMMMMMISVLINKFVIGRDLIWRRAYLVEI